MITREEFLQFRSELMGTLRTVGEKQDEQTRDITVIRESVARLDERTNNLKDAPARAQGWIAIALSVLAMVFGIKGH